MIDWGRSNLSQLEMDSFKNFEEMNAEYVMQNKDSLSADEIGKFFDKKSGKLKAIMQGPDDYELGEIEIDDDGNVSEKPPTPRMKIQPKIPDSTISKDIGNHKKKLSLCFVVAAFLLLI